MIPRGLFKKSLARLLSLVGLSASLPHRNLAGRMVLCFLGFRNNLIIFAYATHSPQGQQS